MTNNKTITLEFDAATQHINVKVNDGQSDGKDIFVLLLETMKAVMLDLKNEESPEVYAETEIMVANFIFGKSN